MENFSDAVYKCVVCSKILDGRSVILKCLHIVCKSCLTTEKTDSGMLCICRETTNKNFKDYSIVFTGISSTKTCCNKNCTNEVNSICSLCKNIYCKPCSKEHPCFKENQNVEMSYSMTKSFDSCPSCEKKCVEVYCTKCCVMICSLCHLTYHRKHRHEVLENYVITNKSNLCTQKLSLEENDGHLKYCLENIENQIKNLELKKMSIYKNIDKEMDILFKEIKKRADELKNSVDINVSEIVSAANENKNIFEEMRRKNKYYIALTQSILTHGKPHEIVQLSKFVLDRTNLAKQNVANVSQMVSEIKIDMNFDNQNIEHSISSIKKVGSIISSKVVSLADSINAKNVFQHIEEQVDVSNDVDSSESSSEDSEESSEYEPLLECSACNQWAVTLIQCKSCKNYYHNTCHIPLLQDTIDDKTLLSWTCTLCKDLTKYSKSFIDVHVSKDTPLSIAGKKVMEYILLALYCQNDDSEHFRECPDKTDYPLYYEKVTNPISLNDIKTRLECADSYSKLFDVIKDLQRVFSNAINYYSHFDPYYASACSLLNNLNKMLAKWFPNMDA